MSDGLSKASEARVRELRESPQWSLACAIIEALVVRWNVEADADAYLAVADLIDTAMAPQREAAHRLAKTGTNVALRLGELAQAGYVITDSMRINSQALKGTFGKALTAYRAAKGGGS